MQDTREKWYEIADTGRECRENILIDESKGRTEFDDDDEPCEFECWTYLKRTLMETSDMDTGLMNLGLSPRPPEESS